MPANSASLSTAILALSPKMYWKLDEVSGTFFRDYGVYNANLNLFGGSSSFPTTAVPAIYTLQANGLISGDRFSKGVAIGNGTNGAWANADSLPLPLSGDLTVVALVRLFPGTVTQNTVIFSVGANGHYTNSVSNYQLSLGYNHANNYFYNYYQSGPTANILYVNAVSNPVRWNDYEQGPTAGGAVGKKNFVVFTKDSINKVQTFYVYNDNVNSPNVQSFAYTFEPSGGEFSNTKITIGSSANGWFRTNRFEVAHVAYYSSVLTKLNIDDLAANAGFYGNTAGNYPLDNTQIYITTSGGFTKQKYTTNNFSFDMRYALANSFARTLKGFVIPPINTSFLLANSVNKQLATINNFSFNNNYFQANGVLKQKYTTNNYSWNNSYFQANNFTKILKGFVNPVDSNNYFQSNGVLKQKYTTNNYSWDISYIQANNFTKTLKGFIESVSYNDYRQANGVLKQKYTTNNFSWNVTYSQANNFARTLSGFVNPYTNINYRQANSFARILQLFILTVTQNENFRQANNFARILSGFITPPNTFNYSTSNAVAMQMYFNSELLYSFNVGGQLTFVKTIRFSIDPLIDPTMIRPQDAYKISYIAY